MKMILSSLFVFLCALALKAPVAEAFEGGYGHGNGGDMCENRFKTVRDDLREWIVNGGPEYLRLPTQISHNVYKQQMLEKIDTAKISCIDRKILIDGAEKTCRNFVKANGSVRIQCNRRLFLKQTTESDQYVLVHHEYAGLAGFEVNDGGSSSYEISNQITGYLEDQMVKKLAVKPSLYENPFSSASCVGPQMSVQQARALVPANTERIEFPTFAVYTTERRCADSPACTEWTPVETQMPYTHDNYRTSVQIPPMGSIAFNRTANGIAITLSTPLHERSGYGVSITCVEQGQGEITGRCYVKSLPDNQDIGEAYGTISAHCTRLTFIEHGTIGTFPSRVWGIRQMIFTAKY